MAIARALFATLPAVALLALGGRAVAQVPRGLSNGVGTTGLGGIDSFGVHGDPLSPDPLARGSGLSANVEASERGTFSNTTGLYGDLSLGGTGFLNRDRAEASGTARVTLRQPEIGQRGRTRFLVTGLGRGAFDLVRNRLVLDLTAYADVTSRDQARGTTIDPINQNGNQAQIFLLSAQPRFRKDLGEVAILNANYRASYVSVTGINGSGIGTTSGGGLIGGSGGVGGANNGPTFQPLSDTFTQAGNVSISNQPRDGRFIVTLSGNISQEQQKRLEQRFRSQGGTLDLTYAITRPVALLGSVGYQDYKSTEQAISRGFYYLAAPFAVTQDPFGDRAKLLFTSFPGQPPGNIALGGFPYYATRGNPGVHLPFAPGPNFLLNTSSQLSNLADPSIVLLPGASGVGSPLPLSFGPLFGPRGDFIPDPSGLRQTTYAQHGLVWNVGFRYAPSRRSLFELRVGQRFADVTVTGSIRQQFGNGLTILGSLSDGIETFSSIVTDTVNGIPTSFVGRGSSNLGGCLRFALDHSCIDSQSVTSGVFRSRYGTIGASLARGLTDYRITYVYTYRRYLDNGATLIADPTFAGRSDTIQRVYATASHRLSGRQRIEGGVFVGQSHLGLSRNINDTYVGALANYDLKLSQKIDAFASASVTERVSGTIGNNLYGTVALGARYHF